jgi:hypothetical protein
LSSIGGTIHEDIHDRTKKRRRNENIENAPDSDPGDPYYRSDKRGSEELRENASEAELFTKLTIQVGISSV